MNAEKIMILPEAVSSTPAAGGAIEFIPSEWAKEEVAKAEEFGLLAGLENINYQANITRADFAKLIMIKTSYTQNGNNILKNVFLSVHITPLN